MSRIALIGENSIGYVSSLLDIWNKGNCAVLLDWRIPVKTAIEMIVEASVSECYIDQDLIEKYRIIMPENIRIIAFEKQNVLAELLPDNIYEMYQNNYNNNEAVVIYSSGTTGKSKGIVLSHYSISTNADAIIDYMSPTLNDCIYISKSLTHSSTLTGELLVALKTRTKLVISPTIVPPRSIFCNISKFHVTIICLNPALLSMCINEYERKQTDISSLSQIYVSGSILNDSVYHKAHSVFANVAIYNVYGLSEAGPRVTAQRSDCCISNSVGKPVKGVEISIVNEQGVRVPNGKYGIIHIKTPSIFDKYIVGEQKHKSLYQNWHNTGDVGYIDSYGELHIVNRLDDVIIIDSHKIYPSEVENAIMDFSEIKECAIVKIDYLNNEIIGCLYVSENEIDRDIKEKLKKILLPYEIPRAFSRCNCLPRNKNGKLSICKVKACLMNTLIKENNICLPKQLNKK